jgi:hypothetical protein
MEHEIEEARARLAADLDHLRAPESFAEFKQAVVDQVSHSKDQWIEQGKAIATDRALHLLEDLKSRAAANPLAAGAIGAGLLWHLSRHPPITSLLVGAGVFSLLRTDPQQPSSVGRLADQAQRATQMASEKLSEWGTVASEAATQARTAASSVTTRDWADQSRETAEDTVSELGSRAGELAANVARGARSWNFDDERRDSILLGAATAALAAALGIAYQRRASQ